MLRTQHLERLLSKVSEWDARFERERAPWIELAAAFAALTLMVVSFLTAVDGSGN